MSTKRLSRAESPGLDLDWRDNLQKQPLLLTQIFQRPRVEAQIVERIVATNHHIDAHDQQNEG